MYNQGKGGSRESRRRFKKTVSAQPERVIKLNGGAE